MTDLGAGVWEHGYPPDPEPGAVPTCPVCGKTGHATRIDNPHGTYYCSCSSLYWGTDSEWRRWAKHRRLAAERPTLEPIKPQPRPIPRRAK